MTHLPPEGRVAAQVEASEGKLPGDGVEDMARQVADFAGFGEGIQVQKRLVIGIHHADQGVFHDDIQAPFRKSFKLVQFLFGNPGRKAPEDSPVQVHRTVQAGGFLIKKMVWNSR